MIIQNDIRDKKAVYFAQLNPGDIFSYDFPPQDVMMKLKPCVFMDEDNYDIPAIYLADGGAYRMASDTDMVYPLTGKLVITG